MADATTVVPWVSCLHCRRWFVARHGKRQHTKLCRYYLTYVSQRTPPAPCPTCGGAVPYAGRGRPRTFCSSDCYQLSPAYRADRRKGKAQRRARYAQVDHEYFDNAEIFERDGYRCGICGKRTIRTAVVPHPHAPTLDHIVPIVAGGPHTRANVQCAHFICNSIKSDRRLPNGEQLRLLG